jgi:hypothetical protein
MRTTITRAFHTLRAWRTKNTKSLSGPARPHRTGVEIPELLLPVLRQAAEDELERACDNMGNWDAEIRARVLAAAGVVEVFDLNDLSPQQIADLAVYARRYAEPSLTTPTTMDGVGEGFLRLATARELIKLRDHARRTAAGLDG